ncbi:hypothetical protein [Pseudonocardia sp. D17]|uniref:hypothetical protein n=1 Tax=Pseudonocardia sp. D17 TaxID=882661 RepID=UPI0030D5AA3A|nr:hypothetical protein PSD17_44760 [Pseudonocardia sp. D17]
MGSSPRSEMLPLPTIDEALAVLDRVEGQVEASTPTADLSKGQHRARRRSFVAVQELVRGSRRASKSGDPRWKDVLTRAERLQVLTRTWGQVAPTSLSVKEPAPPRRAPRKRMKSGELPRNWSEVSGGLPGQGKRS